MPLECRFAEWKWVNEKTLASDPPSAVSSVVLYLTFRDDSFYIQGDHFAVEGIFVDKKCGTDYFKSVHETE